MYVSGCKYCLLRQKGQFSNISILANTVAEHISEMSDNIYDQLREKAKRFHSYSLALDENTAQLAIHICGVDNNFEVTEELLTMIPMHGQTTGQAIFHQLCDVIVNAESEYENMLYFTEVRWPSREGVLKTIFE